MSLKIHNFLISYPILLKLFFIGLSDFSGSIESKLFLEWTWALKCWEPQEFDGNNLIKLYHNVKEDVI